MAFQTFDFVWKIYTNGVITPRSNIFIENGTGRTWSDVLFDLGKNSKLVQVVSNLSPLPAPVANTFPNGITALVRPVWFFYGDYLDINGNVLQNGQTILSDPSDFKVFPIARPRLYLSNDNPEFRPACLYCGGLRMTEIGVYFGASYAQSSEYWGRLRMQMTFEI